MRLRCIGFALFLTFIAAGTAAAQVSPGNEFVRERIELVRSGNGLVIEGSHISSLIVLPSLYEQRNNDLIWTNPESVNQLLDIIRTIGEDGLNPDDYHLSQLELLQQKIAASRSPDPALQADYDLLLTDGLVRLGYHMLIGKVDPVELDDNWNMDRTLNALDPVLEMAGAIDKGAVDELFIELEPQADYYQAMKGALQRYRAIEAAGGWEAVPSGETLKPGMSDARVIALRKRLIVTGDIPDTDPDSPEFDDVVEAGAKAFQRRHTLDDDGIVGAATIEALNVPVEARVDQIRVNLERGRWVLHDLPDEYVIVNIAGFNVRYIRDHDIIWQSRAQVGKPYRKTPVFRSEIKYLDINPTWTVPPTILNKDILPKLKKDPGYLAEKNLRVLDRDGRPVDAGTINWAQYSGSGFPYLLRQDPGPTNALGRIKFMFPNKHLVYLHDTPSKSLFDRTERAFSSGCIRIENPFDFAELLLDDKARWNQESLVEVVGTLQTRSVSLPRPVTVLLLYWTATVDDDGNVIFRKDIYDRDPAILAGLDSWFKFRSRPVIKAAAE